METRQEENLKAGGHAGEVLVRCNRLGKRFCRDLKRSLAYGVQDIARDFLGMQPAGSKGAQADGRPTLRRDEFWAVDDVSFEVRRGQCLGLIGMNGAGKTTILKTLSGLIKPDYGQIELKGRVGGLIALGAGFNPLLTGRENVYVNGSILGMSRRRIAEKMEEIEAFADIGPFIDAPVQSYSSGMQVRLGFAIAAVVTKPDILLLDEVLAVGDMGFTMKCLNAVREMATDSAVIFVSHNMQWISTFCTDVMVLQKGEILLHTPDISRAIGAYMECFGHSVSSSGSGDAIVEEAFILSSEPSGGSDGKIVAIAQGAHAEISIKATIKATSLPVKLSLYVLDQTQNPVMCFPDVPHQWKSSSEGVERLESQFSLGKMELNGGRYSFVVLFQERNTSKYAARVQGVAPFLVEAQELHWGSIIRGVSGVGSKSLSQ